jgi:hypothetical protein
VQDVLDSIPRHTAAQRIANEGEQLVAGSHYEGE